MLLVFMRALPSFAVLLAIGLGGGAVASCGGRGAPATSPSPAPSVAAPPPAAPSAAAPSAPTAPSVGDRAALAPLPDGTLPRMFTAEQLRAAMPVGHTLRLRYQPAGAPATEARWRVVAADERGCTIASQVYDPAGALVRDEGNGTSTWAELREHAAFPAADTTVTDGTVEVPAGRFASRVYRVTTRDAAGVVTVKTLHFAVDLPGPPVLMIVERDGREVMRMTMLERK